MGGGERKAYAFLQPLALFWLCFAVPLAVPLAVLCAAVRRSSMAGFVVLDPGPPHMDVPPSHCPDLSEQQVGIVQSVPLACGLWRGKEHYTHTEHSRIPR